MEQYYGRALPGPVPEDEFVRASQLYARHALVLDDEGRDLGAAAWHESDIVQRFPDGKAWYVVDARALREPVRERTVADLVEAAREAGRRRATGRAAAVRAAARRRSWPSRRSWRCGCTRA